MKKTLYVCGDSFCSIDPDYGKNWPELIAQKCPEINVINLAIPGASNYLIFLQVRQALDNECDYLIYNATSSMRQEFVLNHSEHTRDSIDRYWNACFPDPKKSVVCTTWTNISRTTKETFTESQYKEIENYFSKFVDLPSMIEKNYIFIYHTLWLISKNKKLKNWAWSRGGFEHHSFNTVNEWDFSLWDYKQANINLWNYYDKSLARPFFHVTGESVRKKACDEYIKLLQLSED